MREDLRRQGAGLRRFLMRLVEDPALADDLAQETFERAMTSEWRREASSFTWLCAIALNLVRDNARHTAHRREETIPVEEIDRLPASDNLEAALLEDEMTACIRAFVLGLPEPQRSLVALHDLAGCEQAEVAALLGITPGNARVILHRGRAALRRRMVRDCDVSFDDAVPCARRPPRSSI